jgi:hypothetical protein
MPNPITFARLCAIARAVIATDPSIDDAEWSEQIKRRIASLRLPYPWPHDITATMRATERAIAKTGVDRPAPAAATPAPAPPRAPAPRPWPRSRSRGFVDMTTTIAAALERIDRDDPTR